MKPLLLLACLLLVGYPVHAQTSTLDGIYTKEQANRGKNIYMGMCRSCHTPASHTGATFEKWWRDKTMADLFLFVSEKMPKNDPGGMAPQDYADVIAYLLTMNAMPAGKAELQPDSAALAPIRIAVKTKVAPRAKSATPIRVRKNP
jgi:mono/diheme cytochrome c family protein